MVDKETNHSRGLILTARRYGPHRRSRRITKTPDHQPSTGPNSRKLRSWPLNKRRARSGYEHIGTESLTRRMAPHKHVNNMNARAKRTYPCIPNSTSTCGSRVSLGRMLGGASLGRFPRPHKDYLCDDKITQTHVSHSTMSLLSISQRYIHNCTTK